MSAGVVDTSGSPEDTVLRDMGFDGFRPVAHLHHTSCLEVPVERGVYVVVRNSERSPEFLERSAAGWFRQQDPSVAIDALKDKWVEGAYVLYIGRARGPGVRSLLRQRVKRYIRFGMGKAVAHAGGRFIWQLRDQMALRIAWLPAPDEDPTSTEATMLNMFFLLHGKLPFANLRQESDG